MAHWLMKSEPDTFGIDDLEKRGTEPWSGVRNYQARNFMRDRMKPGELAFLYHSSCPEPGIYGIMAIGGNAYPDPTQFDRKSPYFDKAATREEPRWFLVDVKFRRRLRRPILLAELRDRERDLEGLMLLRKGSRLSIQPVSPEHWQKILDLE
jgi:predicted RNA-binding protein with PUA-like domain